MTNFENIPAPAKLNLFLHITGRRADGYHQLQTVFQFINLCDQLSFYTQPDQHIIVDNNLADLPMQQDLVWRAASLLQDYSRIKQGIHIKVDKQIPAGAGLGGGSSDAATTLLVLNQLWQCQLDVNELMQLGLKLGADVPVFIHGHAVWAEGVGEKFTDISLPKSSYLLIKPDCMVSTSKIFAHTGLTRDTQTITIGDFLAEGVATGNDCQASVCQLYPQVAEAMAYLNRYDCQAKLTGTGACVFAEFEHVQTALQAQQQIPKAWQAWVVEGLNRSPTHDVLKDFI